MQPNISHNPLFNYLTLSSYSPTIYYLTIKNINFSCKLKNYNNYPIKLNLRLINQFINVPIKITYCHVYIYIYIYIKMLNIG